MVPVPWEEKCHHSEHSPSCIVDHDVIWYRIPLWTVGISFPGWVPSQFLVHPQTPHWQGIMRRWKVRKAVSTAQKQLKYQCVTNTIFIQNMALYWLLWRQVTPSQPKQGERETTNLPSDVYAMGIVSLDKTILNVQDQSTGRTMYSLLIKNVGTFYRVSVVY